MPDPRAGREGPAATRQAGAGFRQERVAVWDNARLLLIVLVVFAHALTTIRGTDDVDIPYTVVFAFHMPAFLLIAGWFAPAESLDRRALGSAGKLLVTWLVAEAGWAAGRRLLLGQEAFPDQFLVVPSWTLWFLLSLFFMRLLLPYLALLPAPVLVVTVVSLGAGLLASVGTSFSASRTLALLPFFVLGWWLRRAGLGDAAWFRAPSARIRLLAGAVAAGAIGAVVLAMRAPVFTIQLLYWRRSYAAMGLDAATGVLLRLAALVLATVLVGALLVLTPRGRYWFSSLGRATMPVYLLHAPLVILLRRTHVLRAIDSATGTVLIVFVVAVLATLVFASPPVARLMRPIMDPASILRGLRGLGSRATPRSLQHHGVQHHSVQ